MDIAQYLLHRLREIGLTHLFAVPGDYASAFLTALDDPGSGIVRVPTINELGAGYAADGYARFRGVGAACLQYGVGSFSALNCIAGSFVERVPVALISASPANGDRLRERQRQILFHHSTGALDADRAIFAKVTVASEIVRDPDAAPAQIDAALVAMLTHRRPVYIEVTQDCWTAPCAAPQSRLQPLVATSDAGALAAIVEAAWKRIVSAHHPVLWFGVEIQRFGLQDRAQHLIDASGLPFTTTSLGKTTLDEAQPRFIGTFAGPASPALTREAMARCDCPIALGAIITDDYLAIMAARYADMIAVDVERARVGIDYFPRIALADLLDALTARFQADPRYPRPLPAPHAPDGDPASPPEATLTYERVYRVLADYLAVDERKHEIVLVLGESTSLYVLGNMMGLPRYAFVAQAAWGSLGHETGAALGIALGSGRHPWVIAGDGGFMMICQELSSLVCAGVDATVFVMSNRGYAIEQAFVDITAFEPGGQFAAFDELPQWDYPALAQAFGARGLRAETVATLQALLPTLSKPGSGTTLVELVIPPHDLPPQLRRLAQSPSPTAKYNAPD